MFRIYKNSFLATVLSMLGVLVLIFGAMYQFGGTGITGIVLIVLGVVLMIAGLAVSIIKAFKEKHYENPEKEKKNPAVFGRRSHDLRPDHVRAVDAAIAIERSDILK